ncbi:MAG: ABC transporter permease [Acidobacteriota bacterium]
MLFYLIKRIVSSIIIILGILTVTFFIIHLVPGDAISLYENPSMDQATRELVCHAYGLDQAILVQYLKWLHTLLIKGDLGYSLAQNMTVSEILRNAIPNTVILMGAALLLNFMLGILSGILSASKQNSKFDHFLSLSGLALYSLPVFWVSLMFLLLFSFLIPIFPPSHMHSVYAESMGRFGRFLDLLKHLALPSLCLGITSGATTARFTRAGLIEIMGEDFIRTARAKGASERTIVMKHSFKNALLPVITLFGLYFPFLIGGSLIVEVIFSWPGMGRVTYNAILARDYPVVIGSTLVASIMVILGNIFADFLYAIVDPRIRLGREKS